MNRFDHNWGLLGKTQVRKMSVQPEFCQMGYGNSSVYINHINRRAGERRWSAVPKMTYKSLPVNRLVRNKELCAGDPMCDHNPDVTGECAGVEQTVRVHQQGGNCQGQGGEGGWAASSPEGKEGGNGAETFEGKSISFWFQYGLSSVPFIFSCRCPLIVTFSRANNDSGSPSGEWAEKGTSPHPLQPLKPFLPAAWKVQPHALCNGRPYHACWPSHRSLIGDNFCCCSVLPSYFCILLRI